MTFISDSIMVHIDQSVSNHKTNVLNKILSKVFKFSVAMIIKLIKINL